MGTNWYRRYVLARSDYLPPPTNGYLTLYHITPQADVQSILSGGFDPNINNGRVSLTDRQGVAYWLKLLQRERRGTLTRLRYLKKVSPERYQAELAMREKWENPVVLEIKVPDAMAEDLFSLCSGTGKANEWQYRYDSFQNEQFDWVFDTEKTPVLKNGANCSMRILTDAEVAALVGSVPD